MSIREDFLEALRSVRKDLFRDSDYLNSDEGDAEQEDASASDAPEVMEAFEQASAIPEQNVGEDEFSADTTPYRSYEPSGLSNRIYEFESESSEDKTIISKNTVIKGALQTEDSIRLMGEIQGDIDCKSNVVLAGKVQGNTAAANAYITEAEIDGDMVCGDSVVVTDSSWIIGNIRAQRGEIEGKVKGDIDMRHAVSIGSGSAIIGNISTDELEIKRGAFINGQIMMYTPSREMMEHFEKIQD